MIQKSLRYTPGRSFGGYKRESMLDLIGLKKFARRQGRELSLMIKETSESYL